MLKRVMLSVSLTIAATIVFAALFVWASTGSVFLGYDGDRFLVVVLFLGCAAFLCWQRFRWPEIALLTCGIALVLGYSIYLIIPFAMMHPKAWPWLNSQLFYADTIRALPMNIALAFRAFGFLFPLPLFAIFWTRSTSASNQAMQPTGGPRTA